jgi:hypothetical protein
VRLSLGFAVEGVGGVKVIRTRYYVASPTSQVSHAFDGKRFVEGEPTKCGIRVQKGWVYWPLNSRWPLHVCKNCARAA